MAVRRTLADWLIWQQRVHPRGVELGLARVAAVARRMDIDRPRCPVITVGGTNGKGSTVAFLAALARAAHWRVGSFTSPHLMHYNERICIDGVPAPDASLVDAFERVEAARGTTSLTFFEYNTLAALDLFAREPLDLMLLEVGLGGRLDAVNLVDADVAVICSIGLDHREWLGDSLQQIGREKAGILRPGRPVVLGSDDMPASVLHLSDAQGCQRWQYAKTHRAVRAVAGRWSYRGARWQFHDLPAPALAGDIQFTNAANALAALEALAARAPPLAAAKVAAAMRAVRLRGRFDILRTLPEWILDVAHNEPAALQLAAALRGRPCAGQSWAVAGILADKDIAAIGAALASEFAGWILCGTDEEVRGTSARVLRDRLPETCVDVAQRPSVAAGCDAARAIAARDDRVVVLGSFHTVGPALAWLGLY